MKMLNNGTWFQVKTKVPSLQADLCMMANGLGQTSRI